MWGGGEIERVKKTDGKDERKRREEKVRRERVGEKKRKMGDGKAKELKRTEKEGKG